MKVLFLVQSCNKERYLKEEQIIRDTWGKRLRKGCALVFYRGDGDDTLKGDVLSLDCSDELKDTFIKTIRALSVFRNENYDFIVRVNTSNWINVDYLLDNLLCYDPDVREFYGSALLANGGSLGIPILRGNILIFNKQILKDLFESIKENTYVGVDDVYICVNLLKYYDKINVDYLNVLKIINGFQFKTENDLNYNKMCNCFFVRCAEYIKETNNSDIIKKIDDFYMGKRYVKPQKIKKLETVLGDIKIN